MRLRRAGLVVALMIAVSLAGWALLSRAGGLACDDPGSAVGIGDDQTFETPEAALAEATRSGGTNDDHGGFRRVAESAEEVVFRSGDRRAEYRVGWRQDGFARPGWDVVSVTSCPRDR